MKTISTLDDPLGSSILLFIIHFYVNTGTWIINNLKITLIGYYKLDQVGYSDAIYL